MKDVHQLQYRLGQAIRDPQSHKAQELGLAPDRLAVYQSLFFNNIQGFVSSAFPVLHSLYSQAQWKQLIRCFFQHHRCQSPIFMDIAEEFLHFLSTEYEMQPEDPPFLLELAHYEWVELALSVRPQADAVRALLPDEVADRPLCLSALAWPLRYCYPVHQICTDFMPSQPPSEPTFLLVYRDETDEVRFIQLNNLTAALLAVLQQQPGLTLAGLCQQLAGQIAGLTEEQLRQGALQRLQDFARRGVVMTPDPLEPAMPAAC